MRRSLGPTLLSIAALVCAACGGSTAQPEPNGPATGTSGPLASAGGESPARDAVILTLRRPDGTFVDVSEMRGRVVLLYVFATFDGVSQMLLTPLRQIAEHHPDVQIVGVATQPGARLLVDAYEHALSPPFPVTYDPEDVLLRGGSALGVVDAIPTLVVIDRRGVAVARHVGFAERAQIEELLTHAGR